jgi:HEAT repeat protein
MVTAEASAGGRARVVEALRAALAGENAATRCAAVRALARVDARGSETAQDVIGRLRDPDGDVRVDAAAALGRMRAAPAVTALIERLESDPDGEVRIETARALGRIGSPAAVEGLIRCLRRRGYPELDAFAASGGYAPSWEVQTRSLEALGEIGDPSAEDAVIENLAGEAGEALQEEGFRALVRLGGARGWSYLFGELRGGTRLARRRAARALAARPRPGGGAPEFPPELVQSLMEALLDPDAGVRIEAARALAGSGLPAAEVAITLLLADRDADVRKAVATLVPGLRTGSALGRLHVMLAEAEPELKRLVVRVLGERGDPASVAPLAGLLASNDDDLLAPAVRALGEIRRPGAEKALAAILADPKRHHGVRALAAWALGRVLAGRNGAQAARTEAAQAREALAAAVRDVDERVSQAALCARVESDPAGAPGALVQLIESPAQPPERGGGEPEAEIPPGLRDLVEGHSAQTSTLAAILAARGAAQPAAAEGEAAPMSVQALRLLAVRLLGNCESPGAEALAALRRSSAAPDAALRREALLSLGRIGDAQGRDALLAGLGDEAREVRLAALEGLAALHGVPGLPARLVALCDDPDAEVRVRALGALAATSEPQAAQHLARALQGPSRDVCRAALRAVTPANRTAEIPERIVDQAFRFSGELRAEAGAALRRLEDFAAAAPLLAVLDDPVRDDDHWIAIDALAALYATETAQ